VSKLQSTELRTCAAGAVLGAIALGLLGSSRLLTVIRAPCGATVDLQPFPEATVTGEIPRNYANHDGIERCRYPFILSIRPFIDVNCTFRRVSSIHEAVPVALPVRGRPRLSLTP